MVDHLSILPDEPVGEFLRRQRVEVLKLGVRDIAKILGVAPAHVSDLEKGRRTPSEALLQRIAGVYRVEVSVLRAGWQKPDGVVSEVATQSPTAAAKVPEFLRTARHLTADDWDALIVEARKRSGSREPKDGEQQ